MLTTGTVPPALSELFLPAVGRRLLGGAPGDLEAAICGFVPCRAAAAGSSWVALLGLLFEEIARRRPGRRDVILPSFSCNEFTKAVLLAGLRPRYVDVRRDLAADVEAIATAADGGTLAVLAINNLGRESENARIRALCDARGVVCVEDATYTFLGRSDHDDRHFGGYGHFAVLNFSEGKIIPVGGGAVLANEADGVPAVAAVRDRVTAQAPASLGRELVSLLVYQAGASHLGYNAYRLLRAVTGADLKRRLSMEPSRAGEVGHDLVRDAAGEVGFRPGRGESLAGQPPRPLGRAKQLVGQVVIARADELRAARRQRYLAFRGVLAGLPHVTVLPYPAGGMYIKAPILVEAEVSAAEQRALDRLGVLRGYPREYPTYGDPAWPQSNRMYDRLWTLPLHRRVTPAHMAAVAAALAALDGRPAATAPPRAVEGARA